MLNKIKRIKVNTEYIKLEQFLKLIDICSSGGEVKAFLNENDVLVNSIKENRRGRKLYKSDIVIINHKEYEIC